MMDGNSRFGYLELDGNDNPSISKQNNRSATIRRKQSVAYDLLGCVLNRLDISRIRQLGISLPDFLKHNTDTKRQLENYILYNISERFCLPPP
jgi:hypothetical protein